ncbi:AraC family transcriptional regulator [Streptomyces sp. PA03-5A]|nr:AraC family transcriptional regulator [Streptomyces sp. PA03-5A]
MDPLEDVLALLETRAHLSTGLVAGGEWAVRFEAPSGVKFNAVRHGGCLLEVEGADGPVELAAGDCFLLTQARPFVLRSAPGVAPVAAEPVFAAAEGGFARVGRGDDVLLVGGRFSFGDRARALLLDALPPVIHVPAGTAHAQTVGWALEQIGQELLRRPVASTLVAEHLAVVMLVHVLRLHLAEESHGASGWPAGLSDPVVAPALAALHRAPAHGWTVAELARTSGVSRSTLAARFKRTVGCPPLDYLRRWRIELASQRLRKGTETLAVIARAVGYGSESALSTAFKEVTGSSPRAYRGGPVA